GAACPRRKLAQRDGAGQARGRVVQIPGCRPCLGLDRLGSNAKPPEAPVHRPIVIGIAGGTGSGTTTAALRVRSHFPAERVEIIHHDNYYRDFDDLPRDARQQPNYDHPDAFETTLLLAHLDALDRGGAIQSPRYDYERHRRRPETQPIG